MQSCSEVKLKGLVQTRDLKRAAHARALRSALSKLIKEAASGVPVLAYAAGAAAAALDGTELSAVTRAREIALRMEAAAGKQEAEGGRTRVRVAMGREGKVELELSKELEMIEGLLGGEGARKEKDAAEEEFLGAAKTTAKARTKRNIARAKLASVDSDEEGTVVTGLEAQVGERAAEVHAGNKRITLAIGTIATFEADFPEVMAHVVEKALPRELFGVWRADGALDELFSKKKKLDGGGRHVVWRCSEGGEEFAVKEFRATDLRTCLRGAALLMRMRHPSIVSIVAVLQDTLRDSVMLQMPFYRYGAVDAWVQDTAPGWRVVRTVLQDVAGALAHLHVNKVVHAGTL